MADTMTTKQLLDARRVKIEPGDAVIYGFGVGRSVAMAEGVVLGGDGGVSLTPSGLVRVRVIRRSYGSGEKRVVPVGADRLVVLKPVDGPLQPGTPDPCFALPSSPLPTQDEVAREALQSLVASWEADLELTEVPGWAGRTFTSLEAFRGYVGGRLAESRRRLEALDG